MSVWHLLHFRSLSASICRHIGHLIMAVLLGGRRRSATVRHWKHEWQLQQELLSFVAAAFSRAGSLAFAALIRSRAAAFIASLSFLHGATMFACLGPVGVNRMMISAMATLT